MKKARSKRGASTEVVVVAGRLEGPWHDQRSCGAEQASMNKALEPDLGGGPPYIADRNLPVDEVEARRIAEELLVTAPQQGYVTISNALQWRLQYGHAIKSAGKVAGLTRLAGVP
jgi:hypothetical protein